MIEFCTGSTDTGCDLFVPTFERVQGEATTVSFHSTYGEVPPGAAQAAHPWKGECRTNARGELPKRLTEAMTVEEWDVWNYWSSSRVKHKGMLHCMLCAACPISDT